MDLVAKFPTSGIDLKVPSHYVTWAVSPSLWLTVCSSYHTHSIFQFVSFQRTTPSELKLNFLAVRSKENLALRKKQEHGVLTRRPLGQVVIPNFLDKNLCPAFDKSQRIKTEINFCRLKTRDDRSLVFLELNTFKIVKCIVNL